MATDYSEHPAICDAVQEVADKHFDDLHFTEDDIADATRIIAAAVAKCVEPYRELAERAVVALHIENHSGINAPLFEGCRKFLCNDWHALNPKEPPCQN